MICFDLYVNGEKLSRAGMEQLLVLTCILDFVKASAKSPEDELAVSLGGLYDDGSGGNVHPAWVNRKRLIIGDEVKIKIVESDVADKPADELVHSADWLREKEREYFESVKAKFEALPSEADNLKP
jgi:hypothetical protein